VGRPEDAPQNSAVLLSAHGSAPGTDVRASRARIVVDAACPLVSKVHREMRVRSRSGDAVVYVGHRGHDETEGAIAHASGRVHVIERADDVDELPLSADRRVTVLAQTTVAFADWERVVDRVRGRFASTWTPPRQDICFATTNRQDAVRALAGECDAIIVVGSQLSSNTAALVATARAAGIRDVYRVLTAEELPRVPHDRVGIIAGASTPGMAVEHVVAALEPRSIRTLRTVDEDHYFPLAPAVRRQIEAAIAIGTLPEELVVAYRDDRQTSSDALLDLVDRMAAVRHLEPVGAR